jgi:hypothetical protein
VHGDPLEVRVSRAAKAPVAKKAPTKKAPAKKAPARRAPAKKASVTTIDAAADAADVEATPADVAEVIARKEPADEPLIDPAVTKTVASEAATGARAADPDKG